MTSDAVSNFTGSLDSVALRSTPLEMTVLFGMNFGPAIKKLPTLIEVARFRRKSLADERALVLAAMGIPYWLLRDEEHFRLCVAENDSDTARVELEKFEGERTLRSWREREPVVSWKIPLTSIFVFVWLMIGAFAVQQSMSEEWSDRGVASNEAILRGEIWRTITALTLHADGAHLLANLLTGALFAAFLIPLLGTGLTWFAIVGTGAIGNWLNAASHRAGVHNSIGASTAVFAALGLLVGCQFVSAISTHRHLRLWEIIVPLGAGLSLLAFLGVGDEHVDFMAHFFGMGTGVILGVALAFFRIVHRLSAAMQNVFALIALLLPVVAWLCAFRSGGF